MDKTIVTIPGDMPGLSYSLTALRFAGATSASDVVARLLRQSWKRPALLSSYWTGFIMLLRYLNRRAGLVEKQ